MANCPVCDQLPPFAKHMHSYPEHGIASYDSHPLIRALGPLMSDEEAMEKLLVLPYLPKDVREQDDRTRIHQLGVAIKQLYIPNMMEVRIQRAMEQMLYQGHVGRNPFWPLFHREVNRRTSGLLGHGDEVPRAPESTSSTMLIRGFPGVGKSRGVQRCLSLYTPVIYHSEFQGQPFSFQQRVGVKIDCPSDGSVRGLCLQFLQELDTLFVRRDGDRTHYWERYRNCTKNELLSVMADLTLRHGIGLLVVDEIQNLLDSMVDGPGVILNFLVSLDNTVGVPVILVGTYAADEVVLSRYHKVRRAEAEGHFEWIPMARGEEWHAFVKTLWNCQVLRKRVRWTRDFSDVLYELSFGVTDIALRLFRFAQEEAIDEGAELLTPDLVRRTAKRHCHLTAPVLAALEAQDWSNPVLDDLDDILPLERRKELTKSQRTTATVPDENKKSSSDSAENVAGNVHQQRPAAAGRGRAAARRSAQGARHVKGGGDLQTVVQEGIAQGKKPVNALKEKELLATPSGISR